MITSTLVRIIWCLLNVTSFIMIFSVLSIIRTRIDQIYYNKFETNYFEVLLVIICLRMLLRVWLWDLSLKFYQRETWKWLQQSILCAISCKIPPNKYENRSKLIYIFYWKYRRNHKLHKCLITCFAINSLMASSLNSFPLLDWTTNATGTSPAASLFCLFHRASHHAV